MRTVSGLSVRISGEGAVPVVFLHGFLGSARDWEPVSEALHGRLTVCVDLPGHGRSVTLADPLLYTMNGLARALVQDLDALGFPRFVLVGYSMGGRVALHAALGAPDRCGGLLLESASPGIESDPARVERLELDRARARALVADPAGFVDAWYAHPMWESLRGRPGLLARLKTGRQPAQPEEAARALVGLSVGADRDRWGDLAEVGFPVLAMAGLEDAPYAAMVRRMEVVSSRIETVLVPDAGHNVHVEKPEVYLETLNSFLSRSGVI